MMLKVRSRYKKVQMKVKKKIQMMNLMKMIIPVKTIVMTKVYKLKQVTRHQELIKAMIRKQL